MRYIILTLCTTLIIGLGIANAQNNPTVVMADSVITSPVENITVVSDLNVSNMPILDFPPEARIRHWWPDTGDHYFMPNVLEANKVEESNARNIQRPKQENK